MSESLKGILKLVGVGLIAGLGFLGGQYQQGAKAVCEGVAEGAPKAEASE